MAALPFFPILSPVHSMMTTLRALIVALLLIVPAGAAAQSDPPTDPSLRIARALIDNGRFEAALAIVGPLVEANRVEANTLFLFGLASSGASQRPDLPEDQRDALLDQAILAFHSMLIGRPGLVRVRLELARAFFLKGEDDLAREHFERVLAGRPAPPVVVNVQRHLALIRQRKRWTSYLGGAVAPDTNIGAASEADIIYIHGLPFRRDAAEAGARSGVGVSVWGGAEYQVPLAERWRLRAGGDLARREYSGSDFDQTFAAIHLGPRWLIDPATEASLLATAERRWSSTAPQNDALGPRLEVKRRLSQRVTANGRLSWQERSYRIRDHLDGPVMSLSAGGDWVVAPTVRLDATLGYGREKPKTYSWRNATRWARAGVSVALPEGYTVGGGGELRLTDYRGRWYPFVLDGGAREDRTRIFRVTVLNRSLTVFGFSPQLVLVNEARTSNAQLYDYKRTRGELRVQRLF